MSTLHIWTHGLAAVPVLDALLPQVLRATAPSLEFFELVVHVLKGKLLLFVRVSLLLVKLDVL